MDQSSHNLAIYSNGDVAELQTHPPGDVRRLPAGRKFARLLFDFELWGVSRPTKHHHGAATLGKPQTIKALFPVGMPITRPWAAYWADLFSLEQFRRLYRELNRAERDFINNALLGATVGWRAVTNKHGHDNGYAEYWTGKNSGAQPMQQETITFGGAVVELVTGVREIKAGNSVYQVYILDALKNPPDVTQINQFTAPWAVCYANISRREPILDAQGRFTGKWIEKIVTPWPQLPTGVPIPWMGKGDKNYIDAERIQRLPDNAIVPKFYYP